MNHLRLKLALKFTNRPENVKAFLCIAHFTIIIHTVLEPIPTGEPIQQSRLQPKTGVRALTSSRKSSTRAQPNALRRLIVV